jgi:hypothetical protein
MAVYYFVLAILPLALISSVVRERSVAMLGLIITAAVTIVVSALRWMSDVDHPDYAAMFEENPNLDNFNYESIADLYGEPGYLLLSAIFKSLDFHFAALSAFCVIFSLAAKAWVVWRFTRAAALALSLYLCVHFITIEFIQIRWAVASSLIALAIYFQFGRRLMLAALLLCVATSFHYFSAAFVFVCLIAEIRSFRVFNAVVIAFSVTGFLLARDASISFANIDSELYVIRRTFRYLAEPLSDVGVLSYARLLMVPVAFQVIAFRDPAWRLSPTTEFLRRISYASIALTMLLSLVPIMHFRAVVLADIFSMALIVRSLESNRKNPEVIASLSVIIILYVIWYVMDISNYINADRLYAYKSWLHLIF